MMIEVLGSGCPTCKKLYEIVKNVAKTIGDSVEVNYVTGIDATKRIIELGSMSSPVLVVDGKIAYIGFTPDEKKLHDAIVSTTKKD